MNDPGASLFPAAAARPAPGAVPSRTSENPLRRAYWLGEVDARPAALLRIALGVLVAVDLLDRLRDFHAFYAPGGILIGHAPRGSLGVHWSIFALVSSSRAATLALFLAGVPLALAFAAGYRSRLASVALWVFVHSLHDHNTWVCDGGDMVVQALLFWMMFVDAGAALSLDVRLGRRRARATIPAAPVRMIQLQIALIYAVTFLAKRGPTWHDGTAILRALASSDWGRGPAAALAAHPALCRALTYATLAVEGAFPLLVLSPWRTAQARGLAIVSGLALHLGIFLNMRVGIFSEVMPVSYFILVPSPWIDRVSAWWRSTRPLPSSSSSPASSPRARATLVLAALLAAQMSVILLDQILTAARVHMPAPLLSELALIAQRQNWRMFSPDAPLQEVSWRAPGALADGASVDLVPAIMPGLGAHQGFLYSRWHRLRNTLAMKPPDLLLPLGSYVCRRWRLIQPDRPLLRFELVARSRPTLSQDPPTEATIFTQPCDGRAAGAAPAATAVQ